MKRPSTLNSVTEFRISRRNLPHWESPGSAYFVTFRTADGYVLSDKAKNITLSGIEFHAGRKYTLHACVVMDSHVHLVVQPLQQPVAQASLPVRPSFYSISQITHSIKSYSANRIQKLLGVRGRVWMDESYDRIIRDQDEYLETLQYIIDNPLKEGLIKKPEDYRWLFVQGIS